VVDFANPVRSVTYSALRLLEGPDDDGSVTGSIVLTLSGDTFAGTNGVALGGANVSNVPEGLTAAVTKTSATTATLTFAGAALANTDANDIGNVTLTLDDVAFTLGSASGVTGASRSDLAINFGDLGSSLSRGTAGSNVIPGTSGDDVIHGLGGQDVINGLGGDDSIDISDAGTTEAASATVVVSSVANGLDAVSGFKAGALSAGGDVIDLSRIVSLAASVSTGLSTASNFSASNVFVFDTTPVTIEAAAAAIAADADVTATQGYIVIADSARGGVTTLYHSSDLANNGTETALVMLSGVSTASLVAQNLLLSAQGN